MNSLALKNVEVDDSYDEGIDFEFYHSRYHFDLANNLMKSSNYDLAIKEFYNAIASGSDRIDCYISIIDCFLSIDNIDDACACFESLVLEKGVDIDLSF
jgi:pentatricopeptide repeat protein